MNLEHLPQLVTNAVDAWAGWLTQWMPPKQRVRARVCPKCTGSPLVAAAGFPGDTPHQVTHALIARMHRLIDKEVDKYTREFLPILQSELDGSDIWNAGAYDPGAGLDAEYDGVDPDAVEPRGEQPFLFTFAELQKAEGPGEVLPRPPLTQAEKRQLKMEIDVADRFADQVGRVICFELLDHQVGIRQAIQRFVDPQIQQLLDELSRNLQAPNSEH